MSETNPLFEADDAMKPWFRQGFAHAGARFFAFQAGLADHPAFQEVVKANAAWQITNSSSTTLAEFGDVAVVGLNPAQPAATAFFMTVGDVAPVMIRIKGYPEEALALSSPTAKLRQLTTSEATAFSNAEIVRRPWEPKLVEYLRYLRIFFRRSYGAALASRLEALAQMMREDEEQVELSVLSVAHLIGFLEKNSLSRPKLAVGPSGEIVAFWRHEGEGEFSARFLPNGSVRFLVNKKNPKHPEGVSRSTGDTTLDELFSRAGLADLKWTMES